MATRPEVELLLCCAQTCLAPEPEAVPKVILAQLQHSFYANVERNLFLAEELLRILLLLKTHGTCAIPYKGPTLAAMAYGNLALRQFGDLDILVAHRTRAAPRRCCLPRATAG